MTGSLPDGMRCTLWDRAADGGGPGGGGGTVTMGSHLTCDEDRDLADVGVAIAGVDAALRAAGGMPWDASESFLVGIWRVRGWECPGMTRCIIPGRADCVCESIEMPLCSGSLLRLSEGSPNRRSRDGPLPPGGGGKDVFAAGCSATCRCGGGGAGRPAGGLGVCPWSKTMLAGRPPLRGGEYGGGGSGEPSKRQYRLNLQQAGCPTLRIPE